jgi:hypothetical protein
MRAVYRRPTVRAMAAVLAGDEASMQPLHGIRGRLTTVKVPIGTTIIARHHERSLSRFYGEMAR